MISRRVVELTFLPLMLALAGTGALLAASEAPKWAIAGVLVIAVGASFAAERMAPYEPAWNASDGDQLRDAVHALVNEGTVLIALLLLPSLVRVLAIDGIWPTTWPFAAQLAVAVLVADLGITVVHRWSHRIGWLWRLHAVHHSVPRMYGFNGLMKHPLHQVIELTAGVTPLVLAGVPGPVATGLAVCVAVQLLLQHSNVDYATGGLDAAMAWNRPHRLHHVAAAGHGDVNFGLFTNLWDRFLLGTSARPGLVRLGPGDLGVAGRPDYPKSWLEQMVEPFRARATPE